MIGHIKNSALALAIALSGSALAQDTYLYHQKISGLTSGSKPAESVTVYMERHHPTLGKIYSGQAISFPNFQLDTEYRLPLGHSAAWFTFGSDGVLTLKSSSGSYGYAELNGFVIYFDGAEVGTISDDIEGYSTISTSIQPYPAVGKDAFVINYASHSSSTTFLRHFDYTLK